VAIDKSNDCTHSFPPDMWGLHLPSSPNASFKAKEAFVSRKVPSFQYRPALVTFNITVFVTSN
jgi:hypothetical protein